MAYIFQSRQLHPRYCGPGMSGLGLVGPDQPWTRETAGKQLVARQESCNTSTNDLKKMSEFAMPKTVKDGEVVDNDDCFKTGRIWEARRAGNPRSVEWCCPKPVKVPHRPLTAEEMEQYGAMCNLSRDPVSGAYSPMQAGDKIPKWYPADGYVGSTCNKLYVIDEGYQLVCCPYRPEGVRFLKPDTPFVRAESLMTPEQTQEREERVQQEIARREDVIAQHAVPEGTFLERYGFPLLLVAGTVGIGVTAALFKRFSVASKQAKEAKAAAEALR